MFPHLTSLFPGFNQISIADFWDTGFTNGLKDAA
jgi:hypothetical protein